jgi:hypothetical protein
MKILNKNPTVCTQNEIQENSINYCDFLKFIISVRGGHCDYSLREPEKSSYATGGSQTRKWLDGQYDTQPVLLQIAHMFGKDRINFR